MVLVDRLAKRYGVPPWQVLQWDPWQLGVSLAAMSEGLAAEMALAQATAGAEGGMLFPVVILAGG